MVTIKISLETINQTNLALTNIHEPSFTLFANYAVLKKKYTYHYFHLFYMDIVHIFYLGKVLWLLYFYLRTVFVSGAIDAPKQLRKLIVCMYLISLRFWKEIKLN